MSKPRPPKMYFLFFALCLLLPVDRLVEGLATPNTPAPISLSTRSSIQNQAPVDVHFFLATPENWPKIVASSFAVEGATVSANSKFKATTKTSDVTKPFKVGDKVDEIFGLPPIIPLKVQWTCTKSILPTRNKPGRLEFDSSEGLRGVASDCRMIFDISPGEEKQTPATTSTKSASTSSSVELTMEYNPTSPIARLAIPVLTLDNAFALKVLLPWTINGSSSQQESSLIKPLDKFRQLMGSLYGVAGLAHLVDCLLGPSQLLTMAGTPPFAMLPLEGQAYAIVWCLMGPVSFILSWTESRLLADLGLVLYGIVEIAGAGLISLNCDVGNADIMDPFVNAILVQLVVVLAWLYSSQQIVVQEDQAPPP